MPVQINEVIIKAVIDPGHSEASSTSEVECPPSGNSGTKAEILEKVFEIIREKPER